MTPLVFAKDEEKYESLTDEVARQALVNKAQSMLGRGSSFGRELQEQCDEAEAVDGRAVHYRKPHWALVWTGPGRTIPKMALRKGSWVNAGELFNVPMGYMGRETEEEMRRYLASMPITSEAVYFLMEEGKPRVKIGRTDGDPDKRRRDLQTGNSDRLVLLGYIATGKASRLEAELHRELRAKKLSGEWFYLTKDECTRLIVERGGRLESA